MYQAEVGSNIAQNPWLNLWEVICANSVNSLPKEKFGQVKVGSNIAQNRLCSR